MDAQHAALYNQVFLALIKEMAPRLVESLRKTLSDKQREKPALAAAIIADMVARSSLYVISNQRESSKEGFSDEGEPSGSRPGASFP